MKSARSCQQLFSALVFAFPLVAAAMVFLNGWEGALRFEREAVAAGEWWRLLTGHLAHLGGAHLLWNAAGFVLAWALLGGLLSPTAWAVTLVLSGMTTSLGLLWWVPALEWYVGLSGVLHGALVAGAAAALVAGRAREGGIVLILVLAKLLWEQWAGPLPGTESAAGGPVVVEAHLYGALGGLLAAPALLLRRRRSVPETP